MKGKNNIELNREAVQQMIQHYFDTVVYAEGQSPVIEEVYVNQVSSQMGSARGDDFRKLYKIRLDTIDRKEAFLNDLQGE